MDFIVLTGCTYFCLPSAYPAIRAFSCDLHCLHYANWLLLQLNIEADITRGCF